MIEKLLQRVDSWRWLPFDVRFKLSYNWLKAYQGWKASLNTVFKVKQLESFPAGENPFWHDQYHTGVSLGSNIMAMNTLGHEEVHKDYIILHHKPSGQRIRIDFKK